VTTAALTVRAADATGTWEGMEPTYGCAVDGLASWDGEGSTFSVKPTVSLDTKKTDGKTYDELEPGTYAGVLEVTDIGTLKQNSNGLYNYTVTAASSSTATGTLTVDKAQGSVSITGNPSKTYDGTAVSDPTVTKNGTGAVTYTYYTGTDTSTTPLASAPKDVGTYTVVAVMAADDHYTSASSSRTFAITSAASDNDNGSASTGGTTSNGGSQSSSASSAIPDTGDGMPMAITILVACAFGCIVCGHRVRRRIEKD